MNLLTPCLIVSTLGKQLSLGLLIDAYPIMCWSFANQFVGMVVSNGYIKLFDVPASFRRPFVMASIYGNCGSLPLVIMETLSRMKPLYAPFEIRHSTLLCDILLHIKGVSLFGGAARKTVGTLLCVLGNLTKLC